MARAQKQLTTVARAQKQPDTLFELTGLRREPMTRAMYTELGRIHFPTDWDRAKELVTRLLNYRTLDFGGSTLCVDIESTGLDVYASDFRIRLVQLGHHNEAVVLMADRFPELISEAIGRADRLIVHTSDAFDLLALDRAGIAPLELTMPKTVNTHILAHLLDPRAKGEGLGVGHNLEALCRHYGVDREAKEAKDALKEAFRKEYKTTIEKGWAVIDIDHPDYVRYAGLDVLHGFRLYEALAAEISRRGLTALSRYEHRIARICAQMSRKGMALDVPYTELLVAEFTEEAGAASLIAATYGVENVNSTDQVAAGLKNMGWTPHEFTDTGKPKVDKAVLTALEEMGNPLARSVRDAKRAMKWRESYAQAMLDVRDANDRVHPKLAPLKARTARMAVSRPPFQQLPSRDSAGGDAWRVRRCLLADPGELIFSVDYSTLEMRLLAVMADVALLKQAILDGQDLHEFTAMLLYGPEFTKEHRKIAKNVGYGKVYGGGAAGVARLTGAPLPAVREAIAEYDATFPEIRSYSDRLRTEALTNELIVRSPNGRPLPVDPDRLYAATNYIIQSMARDILTDALIRADDAGLTPYLLLPVHDELLGSALEGEAYEIANELGRIMAIPDFGGIPIDTDASVGGRSWGSLYGAPDDIPEMKEAA